MPWTYAKLQTAYKALSPAPTSNAAAATTLNAQTQVSPTLNVPVQSVADYLVFVSKYEAVIEWAANPPSGASATSIEAAQMLVDAFDNPTLFPVFYMTNSTVASQMESYLSALVSPGSGITGPIDAADQTAILALANPTIPMWSPAITEDDIAYVVTMA